MIKYLSKVLYILPAKKNSLILLLFLFLLVSVLEFVGIGLVGPFINLASNPDIISQNPWLNWFYKQSGLEQSSKFIALVGFLIVVIFCVKSFISWRVQAYTFTFSYSQQGKLNAKLMHAYLEAPYTFHLDKSSTHIIQNIINETKNFSNAVLSTLLTSTANLTIIISLFLLLCITNFFAVTSLLVIVLPLFFLLNHFKDKIGNWGKEGSQSIEAMIRIVNHGLGGIKETRIIGCEPYFERQLAQQTQRFTNACSAFFAFKLLPRIIIETIVVAFLIGFTSLVLILRQDIQQLTGALSVFALASIRFIPALSNLTNGISILRSSSYTVNKLYFDLKALEKAETEKFSRIGTNSGLGNQSSHTHKDHQAINFTNEIVLNTVSYRYPHSSENALNSMSLKIHKGQSVALIGKSGAGKTTLVDVILGLLIPEKGDIIVDGKSIYDNLRSWQNLIGYIPQSIFLIEDTLERNIAFGVPNHLIDRQSLDKAIKAAQLAELVEELPDGVQTFLGERGVRLSGGQRQRVGIARAIYHEREILVLDEATSALDNETEKYVTEAIKSLSGTKTMIFIAHRLTTVEHCDRIYLMEKGQIVKSGSYQEVDLEQKNSKI